MSAISKKKLVYKTKFLIAPLATYSCYILLVISALLKQHTGVGAISFMFLSFWGVWLFLISLLLATLGFVRSKRAAMILKMVNVAVSLVIAICCLSAAFIVQKNETFRYSCEDYVRCIIK